MVNKLTRERLGLFLEKHDTENKVLDVGAGGSPYHKFFPNRITVDIDPKRKPDIVADAHKLPFEDEEFECVLCTEVLEHVARPQQVIDECRRVLKPGGKLILTTRFVYPLHDAPGDRWRFTRPTLEDLFSGFSKVDIEPEGREFYTLAVLVERLIFQTQMRGGKMTRSTLPSVAPPGQARLDRLNEVWGYQEVDHRSGDNGLRVLCSGRKVI